MLAWNSESVNIIMLFYVLVNRDTPGKDDCRTITAAYMREEVQVYTCIIPLQQGPCWLVLKGPVTNYSYCNAFLRNRINFT